MCLSCFVAPEDKYVQEVAESLPDYRAIYEFVRDNIKYSEERTEYFETPRTVLLNGSADCDGQALLLSSLLWAKGYENRVVLTHLPKYNQGHVYVELFTEDGQIVKLDPTCEKCNFGEFPVDYDIPIAYIYKDYSVVVNPKLYEMYLGNKFTWNVNMMKPMIQCSRCNILCYGHCLDKYKGCEGCR